MMTKKETAKFVIQVIVSIASAILTEERGIRLGVPLLLFRKTFFS